MRRKYQRRWKPRVRILFKTCQFCERKKEPNYKDIEILKKYLKGGSKISPRKINGNCAKHQRRLARAIKRARFLALLPFVQRV